MPEPVTLARVDYVNYVRVSFFHVVSAKLYVTALATLSGLASTTTTALSPGAEELGHLLPIMLHALATTTVLSQQHVADTVRFHPSVPRAYLRVPPPEVDELANKALRLLTSCIVRSQRRGLVMMREAVAAAAPFGSVGDQHDRQVACLPHLWIPVAAGLLSEAFDFAPAMQLDVIETLMQTCGKDVVVDQLIQNLSRLARQGSHDVAFASVRMLSTLGRARTNDFSTTTPGVIEIVAGLRGFVERRQDLPQQLTRAVKAARHALLKLLESLRVDDGRRDYRTGHDTAGSMCVVAGSLLAFAADLCLPPNCATDGDTTDAARQFVVDILSYPLRDPCWKNAARGMFERVKVLLVDPACSWLRSALRPGVLRLLRELGTAEFLMQTCAGVWPQSVVVRRLVGEVPSASVRAALAAGRIHPFVVMLRDMCACVPEAPEGDNDDDAFNEPEAADTQGERAAETFADTANVLPAIACITTGSKAMSITAADDLHIAAAATAAATQTACWLLSLAVHSFSADAAVLSAVLVALQAMPVHELVHVHTEFVDGWAGLALAAAHNEAFELQEAAARFVARLTSTRDAKVAKALIAREVVATVLTALVEVDRCRWYVLQSGINLLKATPMEARAAMAASGFDGKAEEQWHRRQHRSENGAEEAFALSEAFAFALEQAELC